VARRIRITTWYRRTAVPLLTPGSTSARAVGRAVGALADAGTLPGATDYEAEARPVGRAWIRRVGGSNLWIWFRFTGDELVLLTVTAVPPVPADPPD